MNSKKIGSFGVVVLFPILLLVIMFHQFLDGTSVLLTTDAAISGSNQSVSQVLIDTVANWSSGILMGLPRSPATQASGLLKIAANGVVWNNFIYGFACAAASFAFLLGYRKKMTVWALLCGVLTAFWLGSNFTLLYAGHVQKPFVVLFFVCALLSAGVVSFRGGLLWGGCTGLMFAQQPDVALFFALFAGGYLVFRIWQVHGFKWIKWVEVLIPAGGVALLIAAGPLLSGYNQQVKGTAQMETENKQEKWEYVTQWSFPPEETIAFVAPGYTGWRSSDPEGPYWGRMGRSAGWEKTRQGFQNFKLENTYLGLIPVAFALFAIFSCRRSKHRAEIIFWSSAAIVSLLLSFGKYFPLYSLFYHLPVVNNIRNPNKFLQVFQMCIAILTVYGVDALWKSGRQGEGGIEEKSNRSFFWIMAGTLGVLGIGALSVSMNLSNGAAGFVTQGWSAEAAQILVANQSRALWHAVFMAAVLTAVFAVFSFPKFRKAARFKNWIFAFLVLIVVVDAAKLSKHYIKSMPRSYIESNALTDFLKKDLGQERVALLSQQGIYNIWVSYLLPYNHIASFNVAQIGRMPSDYQQLMEAGSKNPLRMWRFAGVKYLLAQSSIESQLPPNQLRKVFAYDVAPAGSNGFRIVPNQNGAHAVFEFTEPIPRYALVPPAGAQTDEQVLAGITDSRQPLPGANSVPGSIEVLKSSSARTELEIRAGAPSMLRVAQRWDAAWTARVDGKLVEVERIDFICQGVALPAGEHNVVLTYSPSRTFFYMQCAGVLLLMGAFALGFWYMDKLKEAKRV